MQLFCGGGFAAVLLGVEGGGVLSPFGDDEEGLVADELREVDAAELYASQPSGHVLLAEGEEDILYHFHLCVGHLVSGYAAEGVEFLIVKIDNLLSGGEQRVALAYGVRAAAVGGYFPCGLFGREPVLPTHEEGDSNDEYREYGYEYYVYHYFVSSITVQLCRLRR